ncbi:ABC transporter permease [Vallitalea longa]|uniref:ABC transporter permease n=1 Tax=Vallitalea longa TaxID=2936439 RepID=A0A9W5YBN3_9FIRM|nr:FtsX-like permease family protein [Vallitalea longa]GKX30522.1 ABC transporter permease [Vallitalea longa]
MNMMIKLASKYGKASKCKSRLILLAIILSTCLITTIATFAISMNQMNYNNIINSYGKAEARIINVDDKQIDILKHHVELEQVGINSSLADVEDTYNYNLSLEYVDDQAADLLSYDVIEGRLPEKANEIAVFGSVLEKYEVPVAIGSKLNLKYHTGDENLYYEDSKKFTVTGILRENSMLLESKVGIGLVSQEFMSKMDSRLVHKNVAIKLEDSKDVHNRIFRIANELNIDGADIYFNSMLLDGRQKSSTKIIPFVILGILVIIATIIVIYNIYYISVVEKIQQIGMLSSIGTSPKQLKKMIVYEGILSSVKGIPLGILLGYLISKVLVPMIPFSDSVEMVFSPYIIILSAAVSLFTIVIALMKPSKIAARISPIEALRYSGVATTGKKTIKRTKNSRLGAVGKMAYLNLWRNKKRTIMTILSLTMSGMLFITFTSIFNSMRVDNLTKDYVAGDFDIVNTSYEVDNSDDINSIIDELTDMEEVESIEKSRHTVVTMEYDEEKMEQHKLKYVYDDGRINCDIYGYEVATLDKLKDNILEGALDIEKMNNDRYVIYYGDKGEDSYEIGDKVKFNVQRDEDSTYTEEFTILAKTDTLPIGNDRQNGGPTFIAYEKIVSKYLNEDNYKKIAVDVNKNMYDEAKEKIESIQEKYEDIDITEYETLYNEHHSQKSSIELIGMVLVVVIAFIGLLNLINTMVTSILTRKKELGMLQAIGLSDKQLNLMLQVEGMYYALISGLLSTVIGSRIAKSCFDIFSREATYARWQSPVKEILIMIAVLVIVQYVVTYFITKLLNKESIIDRIIRV